RGLIYMFQYLHGALCMDIRRLDRALALLTSSLSRCSSSAEFLPLWRLRDVTGWPKLLKGDCSKAWEYLRSLLGRFPILNEFFASDLDFQTGLTSYSMLLSLIE